MTITFKFYHDSSLTSPVTSANPMLQDHVVGDSDYTEDLVYLGSTATDTKLQTITNPGSDPVVISVEDANPGTGAPATEIRLSLSPITGAETPGASLNLSATLLSGAANKVPVYMRRTSALGTAGNYEDVTLAVLDVEESAV